MANIGIFGGSFNPPHRGHLLAAAEFQRRLGLDRVILMPAALPPHKALAAGSPDAHTRLELPRLAAQDLPFAEVSDLGLHRSGASYTDMLLTFAQWHAPERIAKLASLAVAHRGKDDGRTLREAAQQLRDRFGADVVLVENDFLPYSSTIARAMLAFRCGEDYLEPAVYDAVYMQGLYHTRSDLRALPLDALARIALPLHDPKRVPHVLGCSHTAAELAARFGEDPGPARRAGLLHDVTKALPGPEQLKLCDKYGMMLDTFERSHPKLLHAKSGAAVAGAVFGESAAVQSAICWHTTGKPDMTLLQKILYLADYMEPNRDFPGVERLRALAQHDLDEAVLLGLEMSLDLLTETGQPIDVNSRAARDFLKSERTKSE